MKLVSARALTREAHAGERALLAGQLAGRQRPPDPRLLQGVGAAGRQDPLGRPAAALDRVRVDVGELLHVGVPAQRLHDVSEAVEADRVELDDERAGVVLVAGEARGLGVERVGPGLDAGADADRERLAGGRVRVGVGVAVDDDPAGRGADRDVGAVGATGPEVGSRDAGGGVGVGHAGPADLGLGLLDDEVRIARLDVDRDALAVAQVGARRHRDLRGGPPRGVRDVRRATGRGCGNRGRRHDPSRAPTASRQVTDASRRPARPDAWTTENRAIRVGPPSAGSGRRPCAGSVGDVRLVGIHDGQRPLAGKRRAGKLLANGG